MTGTYKCAIVGVSGGRARGHAEAYRHIRRGALVAVSTRNRQNLDAFGDEWHIANRYTDYREMFAREKPDLVHVNTPPDMRLEIFAAAQEAGIPALIVEKPLAIDGEDYLAIADFARSAKIKIAINHQLHFHPRRLALQRLVQEGAIGDVRMLDASARMNLAFQGTHILQAIAAFHPQGNPATIFGQVSGAQGLSDTPRKHFAPDCTMAAITFEDGISAFLRVGDNAPYVLAGDQRTHVHKRIAIYGTLGSVQWTMWSWQSNIGGRTEHGEHVYAEEDILGQAAMTEAMFDWMEDETRTHPLHLGAALQDFNIVMKIYMSALNHRVETLDTVPDAGLMDALRRRLCTGLSAQ